MEHRFYGAPPVCFDVNPKSSSITVFGFIDGLIQYRDCRWESNILKVTRQSKLKGAIRKLKFSSDGELLYSISKNRALCVYDVETKQRVRCIRESHDDKPYSMRLLPSSSTKGQQVATGCESGEVKTWDLRVQQPLICTFSDQEEVINALETASHCLLAASSDGTLGAYELRRRRLFIQSESMNNELLSIGVINQCTYVGNGDGYLDVFKNNEYGNIVERIKCDHTLGVDCIQVLEPNVVLTASNEDQSLNLITVKPNKNVGSIGSVSGGVQQVLVDPNNNWLFVLGYMESLIKFWNLDDLRGKISDIAVDRSATDECKTLVGKRCTDSSDFFKDLCKSTLSDGDSDSNSYAD